MSGTTDILSVGILVSGSGSNLQAIIDEIEEGKLSARIACVISNNASAFGLERARRHGIPAIHLDHRAFSGRESYDAALVATLTEFGVGLVVLAGFMRIVTSVLLNAFPNRVMNLHPALLPSFPGIDAARQALEYGVKITGCTVHLVDEGTDTGPVIIQAAVPVLPDDTVETLSARIHAEEHRIYPRAIRLFAEGCITVDGRRVVVCANHSDNLTVLENPL
jgi:phosphoribosylglycinamide formyltransferase 1